MDTINVRYTDRIENGDMLDGDQTKEGLEVKLG